MEKPIDERVEDLEKALNNLLKAQLTNILSFSDAHTVFVREISKLKEKVADLERKLQIGYVA